MHQGQAVVGGALMLAGGNSRIVITHTAGLSRFTRETAGTGIGLALVQQHHELVVRDVLMGATGCGHLTQTGRGHRRCVGGPRLVLACVVDDPDVDATIETRSGVM